MDIGKAFSYVSEDQDWIKKVLIGGLINLVPILSFCATGYWLDQTKKVYEGRDLPLPEWDNFGGYFMKGLMTTIAQLIYSLPTILLACCISFVIAPLGAGSEKGKPGPLADLIVPLYACFGCLMLLYGLFLLVLLPALTTRYAITEQFGAFFQFGPAWQLVSSNTGGYVMAVLVFVIAAIVAGLVGSILCGVGAAFTGFWATLVGAYLFGNFAKGAPQVASAPS